LTKTTDLTDWEKEIPIWKPRIQEWLVADLMVSWFRDKSLSVVLIRDICAIHS